MVTILTVMILSGNNSNISDDNYVCAGIVDCIGIIATAITLSKIYAC